MSEAPDAVSGGTAAGAIAGRIKILIVVPVLGGGGAEMHVARLLAHLDPTSFEGVVVCLRHGGDFHQLLPSHVRVRYARSAAVRSSTASTYLAIPSLVAILRHERADVVCSFLSHSTACLQIALGIGRLTPALVVGLQNNPSRERWAAAVLTWPLQRAYRAALDDATAIVALSNGVAAAFKQQHPGLAGKVSRIYNIGADASVAALAKAPLSDVRPAGSLIVACGRLTTQKDYPTLLRAFGRLAARHPAQLWILGQGPLRPSLEILASELGIAERVRFLGFRKNPFAYMAGADCFVLSSAWEGFANVLVEAMACGTAVVSTRCPFGPDEIITDGVNGVLTDVGDPEALADAMLRVLTNPSLSRQLRAAGATRALDFAPAVAADAYQRVFVQAARRRTAAANAPARPRVAASGREPTCRS